VFIDLRGDVIVCFVDIDGLVDHYSLNSLIYWKIKIKLSMQTEFIVIVELHFVSD
jgi:hypothetical protein